jgi:segregation and condensation protein A
MLVRELELDLEAFEGPFDLLLTLVLKDELGLAEVDVADVVSTFSTFWGEREELDLEACGEFLVLVAALLELKARSLFGDDASDLQELEPEEAAEELARRLEEYRRFREAASWLDGRLQEQGDRYFRVGPAPLAPVPQRLLARQDPGQLVEALRALAVEPPSVSVAHLSLRFPPVSEFLARLRALLRRRRVFDFDQEVAGLSRAEQAVAFLALLELRKANEISLSQARAFAPIRVSRFSPEPARAGRSSAPASEEREKPSGDERRTVWTVRSA